MAPEEVGHGGGIGPPVLRPALQMRENDGDTAFHLMQKNPPDLIISDWNMAPVTGLDLLRKVRADAKLRHIPFIMVTAESKTENVVAAKQAGVSNYIVKPFNADTLRAKIASVFPAMV